MFRFVDLEIDPRARQVRVGGEERWLTAYQFDLLLALARNAGRVMSREALLSRLRAVGDEDAEPFDRSIDVHVARIRAAIEDDPRHPRRLLTVRGAGYVLAATPAEAPE
jgi:DNA-binding response OmpR family regulator